MAMQEKHISGFSHLTVISQPCPCISSLIFQLCLSLSLALPFSLCLCDWLRGLMTHPRQGRKDYKTSVLALFRHTDFSYWAQLNGYISTTQPKHHPYELQLAAMCKGLASLSTCCLERYMKIHTYMADVWGFGLQDMEDSTATLSLCVCV